MRQDGGVSESGRRCWGKLAQRLGSSMIASAEDFEDVSALAPVNSASAATNLIANAGTHQDGAGSVEKIFLNRRPGAGQKSPRGCPRKPPRFPFGQNITPTGYSNGAIQIGCRAPAK